MCNLFKCNCIQCCTNLKINLKSRIMQNQIWQDLPIWKMYLDCTSELQLNKGINLKTFRCLWRRDKVSCINQTGNSVSVSRG
ncbi:hypothetical protein Mapa_005637 [Marchantia paleacea]|nr:hypothetical protein Mapa_005637 [Marchantia paleacea]